MTTHHPADAIRAYILAKDGNRSHLLDAAFTDDASLRMLVRTDSISFPPTSNGRAAIAESLVSRFNQSYENIYTLCLAKPPETGTPAFTCEWLVAMSEKQGGSVRIGCGRYDWTFAADGRVCSLVIAIELMETMRAEALPSVMRWASNLPYPWCSHEAVTASAPDYPEVQRVVDRLTRPNR
jgi:hypothetical protein